VIGPPRDWNLRNDSPFSSNPSASVLCVGSDLLEVTSPVSQFGKQQYSIIYKQLCIILLQVKEETSKSVGFAQSTQVVEN
jgi:hypothetical protein